MLELVYKSNALIELINPSDQLKIMEMSINKNDIMRKLLFFLWLLNIIIVIVDKSKLVILKLDKLYLVIPLTLTKVETKLRNVFINQRPKLDGLARFMQFYLKTFASPIDAAAKEM